ncbi:MAG: hypothetical protein AAE987_05105 [Thermoplasmataceae archaeon]|jgi:DNA-directed RNA polymerase subunit F
MAEYKYLTITEAFELLSENEPSTAIEKQGLEYTEKFHSMKPADVKKAYKDLSAIEGLNEKVIVKIIDLVPRSRETLMVILNSYSLNLTDEKLSKIIDIIKGIVE